MPAFIGRLGTAVIQIGNPLRTATRRAAGSPPMSGAVFAEETMLAIYAKHSYLCSLSNIIVIASKYKLAFGVL